MTKGSLILAMGAGLAGIATVLFIILKIWLCGYEKRVREELKKRYE